MPGFDPFSGGQATEVVDGPAEFDPFAAGQASPVMAEPGTAPGPKETDSSPKIGADSDRWRTPDNHWKNLYAGLDGLDMRLNPEERAVFQRLDSVSDNSKSARAQAINQSYVQSLTPDIAHSVMDRNWPAIRDATANHLGISGKDITDTQLYSAIAKQFQEQDKEAGAAEGGEVKAWTWSDHLGSNAFEFKRTLGNFWESVNKPIMEIPSAPNDLPDMPGMGLYNPALTGGVFNAVKPLIEGVESPLGLATLAIAGPLKAAAETFPLAKAALVGMGGIFTGLMGYGTAKKTMEAPKILRDPNATFQQKVEAVAAPIAEGAATILGALGTAFEALPKERAAALVKELEGKNPAEAAEILRDEAKMQLEPLEVNADMKVGPAHDFLMTAAEELDRISTTKDKAVVKEAVVETAKQEKLSIQEEAKAQVKAEDVIAAEVPVEAKGEAATSIKNAAVDAELEKMGLPKATHGEKTTFAAELEKAGERIKEDPTVGERLIDELNKESRPVSATEDAILIREMNKRRIERDAAEKEFLAADEGGDQAQKMDAMVRVRNAQEAFQSAAEAATKAGTKNAQALALRRMMIAEDYSLAAMEQKARVANEGKGLSEKAQAVVRDLHEKITETQKRFDEYVSQKNREADIARAKEKPAKIATQPKRPPPSSRARQFLTDQASAARERIKARLAEGRSQSGLDPADLADHAIIGAEYLAKGFKEIGEWSAEMVKELGEQIRPYLADIFEQSKEAESQSRRLQAFKGRKAGQVEKIKGKLDAQDFEPDPKREPLHLDEEANRLQSEVDMLKLEFKRQLEKHAYDQSSTLKKFGANVANAYDAARSVMTTGEFSFILRQGKFGVAANPITALKALPDTFRAFASDPTAAHAINLQVLNHPDMAAAKAAKLHILDEGASLNKQEEIMMGRWIGKIPVVHRFNQAATVFLNRLRFDMFQKMRDGSSNTPEVQKQIATYINEATGRGSLGKALEPSAVILGRALFAPRFLASRIQYATGHSLWGGNLETRMIIGRQYAKTLVGLAAYYTLLDLALGDDDKKKPEIGTDPLTSDFGKVKIGNTRIDPLAGVSQVIVFAARTADAAERAVEREHTPDAFKQLSNGTKYSDVLLRFGRSKLHPIPGTIVNLFDGTDLGGNKATLENQLTNYVTPMTYMDIYQALEEQDLPDGVAVSLLAFLGEGLQTYEKNKGKAPTFRK